MLVACGGEGKRKDDSFNQLYYDGYKTGYLDASNGINPRFTGEQQSNGITNFHSDFGAGYNQGYINFQTSYPEKFEKAQEDYLKRSGYFSKLRHDQDN